MITSFFKPKRKCDIADNNDFKKRKINHGNVEAGSKLSDEVSRLIFTLEGCTNADTSTNPQLTDWKTALNKHFSSANFRRLASFVEKERQKYTVFPPKEQTFSALNLCPLSKTKLVIVGQDPYHGPNQAHGLSFSVVKNVKIPPSLRNIYKELMNDPNITNFHSMPTHGDLTGWAQQGVLMLNTVLTVRQGQANSHKQKGWEELTDKIISVLLQSKINNSEGSSGVVFLLWGKPATMKAKTAIVGARSPSSQHKIICTSHPSPLGATKTNSPFLGSKCFSRANEALREMGHDEIDWRVDGRVNAK